MLVLFDRLCFLVELSQVYEGRFGHFCFTTIPMSQPLNRENTLEMKNTCNTRKSRRKGLDWLSN